MKRQLVYSKKLPTQGRFIIIWEYNNKLWSDTCEYIDGVLCYFNIEIDDFLPLSEDNITFYEESLIKVIYEKQG